MGALRTRIIRSTAEGPPKKFYDLLALLIMRGYSTPPPDPVLQLRSSVSLSLSLY